MVVLVVLLLLVVLPRQAVMPRRVDMPAPAVQAVGPDRYVDCLAGFTTVCMVQPTVSPRDTMVVRAVAPAADFTVEVLAVRPVVTSFMVAALAPAADRAEATGPAAVRLVERCRIVPKSSTKMAPD